MVLQPAGNLYRDKQDWILLILNIKDFNLQSGFGFRYLAIDSSLLQLLEEQCTRHNLKGMEISE